MKQLKAESNDDCCNIAYLTLFSYLFADQYKEAKDALSKTRKELKQLQTKHKQLEKYALAFGKAAVNNGKAQYA